MRPVLSLFVFIDACGWQIIKDDPFVRRVAPHRRQLRSVFGYSSACIPSILSGRYPSEHRNWSYFVYDPAHSPFQSLRWMRWLPSALTSRRRVRNVLSAWAKRRLGFKGYFDLYNMPFRDIAHYDFTEKKSPLRPGGMNRGTNIFDFLTERRIPYHVSEPARGEAGNLTALIDDLKTETLDFAFLYWPQLDGLMHRVGNDAPEVPAMLRDYERRIDQLMAVAQAHYEDVRLYIFSDHGMANCDEHIDLRARIDALGLRLHVDYAVVYDSTMARFWFHHEAARQKITTCLERIPQGEILSDAELTDLGTYFPDRYFGELIYLLREGTLIVPSHMGARPIRAMHGYHPDEPHSFAALMSNQPHVPAGITAIPDMYKLMTHEAEAAHTANCAGRHATVLAS
ncbi:alkaline phosphatase family protein [Opitutus sp. ER46]|uniref:alkaline phosphatase family protein n=1 Tax=Opitutus sp. ER46 TaxID=2161864 RepID=UPI000D3136E5|nr:alkaline phosphatase family protein [Opitutus sp. ER46]PTX90730.1 nucleotide pyrophosphatase [Opitutus sp. ER46]